MATFSLGKHPHVELCDLLKLEGWSESGAQAKSLLPTGWLRLMVRLKRVNAAKLSPGKPLALKAKV
ncbi:ribosome-associated protein [Salmonella enterica subsp. diarizonae]|uniref:Ribosome-associated protein n=1 Tax=Salmonella diarizonae TaxID=59204 RepID=A0A379U295_SALDZ|nr:ribosome-associated protein [Salmonella enterica subsp. diarizonae]